MSFTTTNSNINEGPGTSPAEDRQDLVPPTPPSTPISLNRANRAMRHTDFVIGFLKRASRCSLLFEIWYEEILRLMMSVKAPYWNPAWHGSTISIIYGDHLSCVPCTAAGEPCLLLSAYTKHLIRAADLLWKTHKLGYLAMALGIIEEGPEMDI
ncbi:hypothetical protein BKA70DRAFT_1220739 [Coprinopsis sp. MPI-PUGE-AT-0042]|nr:hypothetical protein BKA70DRAFT_1220739 [Coprinopsis sp. MPI-PUGE-AT-0042]